MQCEHWVWAGDGPHRSSQDTSLSWHFPLAKVGHGLDLWAWKVLETWRNESGTFLGQSYVTLEIFFEPNCFQSGKKRLVGQKRSLSLLALKSVVVKAWKVVARLGLRQRITQKPPWRWNMRLERAFQKVHFPFCGLTLLRSLGFSPLFTEVCPAQLQSISGHISGPHLDSHLTLETLTDL